MRLLAVTFLCLILAGFLAVLGSWAWLDGFKKGYKRGYILGHDDIVVLCENRKAFKDRRGDVYLCLKVEGEEPKKSGPKPFRHPEKSQRF